MQLEKDPQIQDAKPFRNVLKTHLDPIFSPLLSKYRQASHDTNQSIDQDRKRSVLPKPLFSIEELESYREGIGHFPAILRKLSHVLKKVWEEFPPSPDQNIEELRQICFEECLPLCRLALILGDAESLLGQNDKKQDIPLELANFIQLEGVEEEIKRRQPPEPTPEPAAVVETKKAPPAPKPQPKPKNKPSLEPLTLDDTNLRKVLRKLAEYGFEILRMKGSHQILAQVVLPRHEELCRGTLRSVQKQARKALQGDDEKQTTT